MLCVAIFKLVYNLRHVGESCRISAQVRGPPPALASIRKALLDIVENVFFTA
jgi:hypothetical protein